MTKDTRERLAHAWLTMCAVALSGLCLVIFGALVWAAIQAGMGYVLLAMAIFVAITVWAMSND